MRIGVVAKTHRLNIAEHLVSTLEWLRAQGCVVVLEERVVRDFGLQGEVGVPREEIPPRVDVIVVFGGDGTLLSAARLVGKHKAPILGVNLGTLGFLTEVNLDDLRPALAKLISGDYQISPRSVLQVELHRQGGEIRHFSAVNDAVINKGALARIIELDVYGGDEFIARYLADGLIVATPTGSTAYSLSAGGPIIFPTEKLIALTPICPHTLTNRPLIIPGNVEVRAILRSGEDVMLTVDGQVGAQMHPGDSMVCTLSAHQIELIKAGSKSFFEILREKLKWGQR